MAAAELIAVGTGALNSADVVVTSAITIGLKGFGQDARVNILLKDDAGGYNFVGSLSGAEPTKVLSSPGTYRLSRTAGSGSCGAYSG